MQTEIRIRTLNGEQEVKLTAISGLKVGADNNEGNKRWIDLQATKNIQHRNWVTHWRKLCRGI